MDVISSPQPAAVGEAVNILTENQNGHRSNQSYASKLTGKSVAESKSQLELCPTTIDQGLPIVEFTVDEINSFTKEEGLHQAVIFKFSYGKPDLQDLRQILPKQLAVKGRCIIGQLEYRHILVRFDLFEDFAQVVSRTNGYLRVKGEEFFYRTFPWTMGFNPGEETSKAVVWISLPELPANLFAQKSILSIAASVGKPIAVDKATKDRTRPSTARVKVLINLLDKHPSTIKIKIVDSKSGKVSTFDQKIVIDNAPAYCTHCCHQGHNVKSCRRIQENETMDSLTSGSKNIVHKLQGDARDLLNEKRATQKRVEHHNPIVNKDKGANVSVKSVWKQKVLHFNANESAQLNGTVNKADIIENKKQMVDQLSNATDESSQQCRRGNAVPPVIFMQQSNNLSMPIADNAQQAKAVAHHNIDPLIVRGHKTISLNDASTTICPKIKNATDSGKKPKISTSLKSISMTDFEFYIANSSYAIGSVSGLKNDHAHQISSEDLVGQYFSCKAMNLNDQISDYVPIASSSKFLPKQISGNISQLQDALLGDQTSELERIGEGNSLSSKDSEIPTVAEAAMSKEELLDISTIFFSSVEYNEAADRPSDCVLKASDHFTHASIDGNQDISSSDKYKTTGHQLSQNPISISLASNDTVATAKVVKHVENQSVTACEDCTKMLGTVPLISSAADIAIIEQFPTQLNESAIANHKEILAEKDVNSDMQHGSITADSVKVDTSVERTTVTAEVITGLAAESETATNVNEDNDQACKSVNPLATKVKSPSEVTTMAGFKTNVIEADAANEDSHQHAIHDTKLTYLPDHKQNAKDGYLNDIKGLQHNNNLKNQGSGKVETGNLISNWKSTDTTEQELSKQMVVKAGNTVKSYPPVPYTYIESKDHEEFSIFNGEINNLDLANMRGLVIKSKLWDQRQCSDEDSREDGSTGFSSAEENQENDYDSSRDSAIVLLNAKNQAAANSSSVLNRNAVAYFPKSNTSTRSVIQFSTDKRHLQNAMETFEEGEEEELLMQCHKDAARKGDLSPMHSKTNKKSRQRDRSWDGRVTEEASIRRPPMRIAKQKQLAQRKKT